MMPLVTVSIAYLSSFFFSTEVANAAVVCAQPLQQLSCDYFGPRYGEEFTLCNSYRDGYYVVLWDSQAVELTAIEESETMLRLNGSIEVADLGMRPLRFVLNRTHGAMPFSGKFYNGARGLVAACQGR